MIEKWLEINLVIFVMNVTIEHDHMTNGIHSYRCSFMIHS